MSANSKLEALRQQIHAIEGHSLPQGQRVLPFADPRLNEPLPGGGLRLGALHEFYGNGLEGELAPAVTAFAAAIAAQILREHDGFILWAASQTDCYPQGLVRFGLNPSRIVWIECAKDAEVLSVMEEALHSRALAAVLGEAGALTLKTGRRLDAAARQSGTTALLLRRYRSKPSKLSEAPCGAAATRWRVSSVSGGTPGLQPRDLNGPVYRQAGSRMTAESVRRQLRHPGNASPLRHPENAKGVIRDRSGPLDSKYKQTRSEGSPEPGLGPPRWRLDLDYCRNGRTASWIVEAFDGAYGGKWQAGHVCVVAELRDDARAPEEPAARKTAGAARSA